MELIPFLVQLLVGIAGSSVIAVVITGVINKNKTNAEANTITAEGELARANAEVTLSAGAISLLNEVRVEAREAKLQSQRCAQKMRALENYIDILTDLMKVNNITPPPFVWSDNIDGTG